MVTPPALARLKAISSARFAAGRVLRTAITSGTTPRFATGTSSVIGW